MIYKYNINPDITKLEKKKKKKGKRMMLQSRQIPEICRLFRHYQGKGKEKQTKQIILA